MKYLRILALSLALAAALAPRAEAGGALAAQSESLPLDELERSAGEYAPQTEPDGGVDLDKGLVELLDTGAGQVTGILRTALKSGILLLVIVLFCSLAEETAAEGSRIFQAAPLAGVLAVCAVSVSDVHSLIGLGREAIDTMATFANVLVPTMAAATAASGAPGGAAALQMATALFSDLLIQLIAHVLIPLVYAYVASSTAAAAIGNQGLGRIAKALKGIVTSILTTVLLAFVGYLSVSGAIAGTTDAVTVKTAKLAMSSMVPVVGGVLSDAAETVLAGAGILRNAVGIFGTLTILGICLFPFLQMGIHYLVYKLAALLSATVAEGKVVGLIDSIGGAFGLVLGMVASCALLLLFSVISCLRAAGVA